MDARVCARPGCGNPLLPGRKLEDVCSYACRGQMKVEAIQGQTGLSGSENMKQNKALRTLKRQSVGAFTFSKTNSCTYRLDRPNKLGAGWLMEVAWPGRARQRWLARIGNRTSEQLTLDDAKRAAVAMLRERGTAEDRDWIGELNKIASSEVDRVALAKERKQWPLALTGAHVRFMPRIQVSHELRKAILDAELPFTDEQLDEPPQAGTVSGSKQKRFSK
jgi:hypothetical protein